MEKHKETFVVKRKLFPGATLAAAGLLLVCAGTVLAQEKPKVLPKMEERIPVDARDPYSTQEVKAVFMSWQWRENPTRKNTYLLCSGRYREDPDTGQSTCVSRRAKTPAVELPVIEAMQARENAKIVMRHIDDERGGGLLVVSYYAPGPRRQ